MRKERLTGWNDLAALADRLKREDWLYRGVTQSDHELIPKIGRPDARKDNHGKSLPYSQEQERLLLREFARRGRGMFPVQPDSELECMAIAQHHGLKTRLLDWTESVFIAAMFATEKGVTEVVNTSTGEVTTLPPVIYGIRGLQEIGVNEDPFQLNEVKVYRPAHISPQIAPQQAVFTVHPNPQEPFNHAELVRWKLEIGGTLEVKFALDAVGISRASLFPGIDGLAAALNWRHKWNVLRA